MNRRLESRRAAEPQGSQRYEINELTSAVIDSAVAIHRDLGPGLLESVYEAILERKLQNLGFRVRRQVAVPVEYEGLSFKEAFRADLIIENLVILELKSVDQLSKAHKKQLVDLSEVVRAQRWLVVKLRSASDA